MGSVAIDESKRRQHDEEGYCIADVLFDTGTLDAVQGEFNRMWQEAIDEAQALGDPRKIEAAKLRWFGPQCRLRSPICDAFCRHPALIDITRQLVGPDVDMTWDQAIVKPPAKGKAFAWHQDAYYAVSGAHTKGVDRDAYLSNPGVTFWIAITRTTIPNGTLWVAPGLHRRGLLPHVWDEASHDWECQFDDSGKVPAELRRGQALLFTRLTPHASGPNVSDEVRMAYQIGYNAPQALSNDYQLPVLRNGEPT